MSIDINEVSEAMFAMVKDAEGKKRYKPGDLIKSMIKQYEGLDKKQGKEAIRTLVDGERLVYTYFNGTFLEIPHEEGSAK